MPFVKIIDTVGSSPESWEQAVKNAIAAYLCRVEMFLSGTD
ncbi:MAG: dodecin family protein [Euryarchaeota archaeon]|nr:dodecin family protein [Euryarchaeota archaeon]